MLIALEGTDGVGKSTIAEKLRALLEERGYEVDLLHRGVPERPVLDEYQHDIEDYRPGGNRAIICDRWHLGDIVYGELYRGKSYLGGVAGAGFRFVELFLRSRGGITILVDGEENELRRRLTERGEDYLQMEHIGHVLSHYREVFKETATGFLIATDPDPEAILKHAAFWGEVSKDLAPFPGYVGSRTPRVLLVGEKRGNAGTPSLCAFRPTSKGNSAEFLLESIPKSMWREVGLVNAYEEDDLPKLLEVLAQPPVVALGRKASERLTELGIEHAGLPHPQYMRRFHAGKGLYYGEALRNYIGTDRKEFSWPR